MSCDILYYVMRVRAGNYVPTRVRRRYLKCQEVRGSLHTSQNESSKAQVVQQCQAVSNAAGGV